MNKENRTKGMHVWAIDGVSVGLLVMILFISVGQKFGGGGTSHSMLIEFLLPIMLLVVSAISLILKKKILVKELEKDSSTLKSQSLEANILFLFGVIGVMLISELLLSLAVLVGIPAETGLAMVQMILYTVGIVVGSYSLLSISKKKREHTAS